MTKVLIAYGSKRGGTVGLAHMLADAFAEESMIPTVKSARDADGVVAYDAVIVAGALYAGRWHKDARRFVHRHRDELQLVPAWLVASGPLDGSASESDIAPTSQMRRLMSMIHARGYKVFGGRLSPDAKGLIASRLAKSHAGDWRNSADIQDWVKEIACFLRHPAVDHGDFEDETARV